MKRTKGILAGLLVTILAVGVVYAAWTVFNKTDNTTVQEPLEVDWVTTMVPAETFPNQEYESRIKIHNVNAVGNGDQEVGVVATRSDGLVRKNICWDISGDGKNPWCGWKFGEKMTFPLAKNGNVEVWAIVEVPSDAAPVDEWVTFEVTRE